MLLTVKSFSDSRIYGCEAKGKANRQKPFIYFSRKSQKKP